MKHTKHNAAKNSASSEFLKNRWLSVHWACKHVTLIFLPSPTHIVKHKSITCYGHITLWKSQFKSRWPSDIGLFPQATPYTWIYFALSAPRVEVWLTEQRLENSHGVLIVNFIRCIPDSFSPGDPVAESRSRTSPAARTACWATTILEDLQLPGICCAGRSQNASQHARFQQTLAGSVWFPCVDLSELFYFFLSLS